MTESEVYDTDLNAAVLHEQWKSVHLIKTTDFTSKRLGEPHKPCRCQYVLVLANGVSMLYAAMCGQVFLPRRLPVSLLLLVCHHECVNQRITINIGYMMPACIFACMH